MNSIKEFFSAASVETESLLLSFIATVILGFIIIPILRKLKVGQVVRQDGPKEHLQKQGTPTMGGIIMLIVILVISIGVSFKYPAILPVALITLGYGLIGFIDDFMKLVLKNPKGLKPSLKMLGLIIFAVAFVVYLVGVQGKVNEQNLDLEDGINSSVVVVDENTNNEFVEMNGAHSEDEADDEVEELTESKKFIMPDTVETYIPIAKVYIDIPVWIFIPFAVLVILSCTNSLNLTDGLDGLAAGVTMIIMIFFAIVAMKLENKEMAAFASIVVGTTIGFLLFNLHPAKVFMGDTGSLALGGAFASIALVLKMPLILLVVAGVCVIEALSVMLQVVYYKVTKGKRLFKMAPIHHHFELSGVKETVIVPAFWAATLLLAIISLIMV